MAGTERDAAQRILERALCLEMDGEAFYREAAGKTADPNGQRMFLDLAEQEAEHQRIIQRQIKSLSAAGRLADEALSAPTCDYAESLFPQGLARAQAVGPRANDLEAIWYALGKENESYELYRQGALGAQDEQARTLYEYLMAAERSHFEILMSNYEEIQKQQYRGS